MGRVYNIHMKMDWTNIILNDYKMLVHKDETKYICNTTRKTHITDEYVYLCEIFI